MTAQLNQLALFLAETLPYLVKQFLAGNHSARGWILPGKSQFFNRAHGAAAIAALTMLPPHFFGDLVASHGQQQLDQISGLSQVKLASGDTYEKDRKHRLTNVHRIEFSTCVDIPETCADHTADDWLEVPHQPSGSLVIPVTDSADEFVKRLVWQHKFVSWLQRDPLAHCEG